MSQIAFINAATSRRVQYYSSFPGKKGKTIPNYFTITPDGKLAQVFIELNPEYEGDIPMSKICDGPKGAVFDPENCFIECDGHKAKYQPNSIVYYDPQHKDFFVFEKIDPKILVDWTARFRTKITIGVKNNVIGRKPDQSVIEMKETPVYVPFSYNGSLIPNIFYFGCWGISGLAVYQKYYAFDITDGSYEARITPFISVKSCKELNKKYCQMFIQVKRKNANGFDVFDVERIYDRSSEVQVSVDPTGNAFSYFDRTYAKGDFKKDEDYKNECTAQGVLFIQNKF